MKKHYKTLYVKRRVTKLEIDILSVITRGLAQHTPKNKILLECQKLVKLLSVQVGLSPVEVNALYDHTYATYLSVSKKTFGTLRKLKLSGEEGEGERIKAVYDAIRAIVEGDDPIKTANRITYMYEYRIKHDELYGYDGLLNKAKEVSRSPFFLASSHPKPALDHADYEGRMYYDERYENYVPEEQIPACRAYIRNHKLLSVQYVTGSEAGIFLTLRRNCKHYFLNLPIEEVMHSSAKRLLKKHNMYMKEEDASVSPRVLAYRQHYNRLKVKEVLYEQIPNESLKEDIKKEQRNLTKYK